MKGKKAKRLTSRTLQHQASLIIAMVALAATVTLALALLTYWLGIWGDSVLRTEVAVGEGLLFLLVISAAAGIILRHCHAVEQENVALKQAFESLTLDKAALEKKMATMEQMLSTQPRGPATDYSLCIQGGKVFRGAEELPLTRQEFRLLECLMRKEKDVCEYKHIFEQVWQEEHASSFSPDPSDRDRLTALVLRLRKKIATIPHEYIRNHPGQGYEFVQWERGHKSQ